jgi:hypothetical protein
MRTTVAVLLIVSALIVGGCAGGYFGVLYARSKVPPALPSVTTTGAEVPAKFQLVSGEYVFETKGTQVKERGVFRINTETGQTSLFVYMVDPKGLLQMYWSEIADSLR